MNEEFLKAIAALKDAFYTLNELYAKPHMDMIGTEDYPFVESFDEVTANVQTWYETCQDALGGK